MSDSDYVGYDAFLARDLVSKSNLASSGGLSTNHLSRASGMGKLTRLRRCPKLSGNVRLRWFSGFDQSSEFAHIISINLNGNGRQAKRLFSTLVI